MKVGVYSNNINVCESIICMINQNGCSYTKILTFNNDKIKGNDLLIIDLDNCGDIDSFVNKINDYSDIEIVGISRKDEILNKYKNLFSVEKKPFNNTLFNKYLKLIKDKYNQNEIINKDINRIYNNFGVKIVKDFDELEIPFGNKIKLLKTKISQDYNGLNEKEFLDMTGLSKININVGKPVIPINTIKKDDALTLYRIKKLRLLNLNSEEIDNKIKELNNVNKQEVVDNKIQDRISAEQQDIIIKLKSGFFVNSKTNKKIQPPKEPIKSNKIIEQKKPIEKTEIKEPIKQIKKSEISNIKNDKNILEEDPLSIYKKNKLLKPKISLNVKDIPQIQKPVINIEHKSIDNSSQKEIELERTENGNLLPKGIPLKPKIKIVEDIVSTDNKTSLSNNPSNKTINNNKLDNKKSILEILKEKAINTDTKKNNKRKIKPPR